MAGNQRPTVSPAAVDGYTIGEKPGTNGTREPAEAQAPAAVVEPLVTLRVLRSALRRSRRLWLSAMVLGLAGGLLAALVLRPGASATATLLLQQAPGVDPTQATATDLGLLQTEDVAQRAITRLHLKESAQRLLTQYSGTSVSSQVLTITASAPSAAEARRVANTLAAAFLDVRGQQYDHANQVVVSALQRQLNVLIAQIGSLTSLLQDSSAGGASSTAPADALVSERDQDIAQEGQIKQTIQTDMVNTASVVDASGILSPAIATQPSPLKTLATDAGIGLLIGLVLGVGGVAFSAAISDRVRRRQDVALALMAPVELSLGRFHCPKWAAMRRLRDRIERSDRVARHLRAKVDSCQGNLAVISVDSLEAASLAVARCAIDLSRDGTEVLVVDPSEHRLVSKLLGVRGTTTPGGCRKDGSARVRVLTPADDGWGDGPVASEEIRLVLATLDPARGARHLLRWASDAVIVVTAGRSDIEKLRANAEMLRIAGIRLDSAVLIGADSDDYSLGQNGSDPWPVSEKPFPKSFVAPVGIKNLP